MKITYHLAVPAFVNFEVSSSIVQLISAFVYLKFAETYLSEFKLDETKISSQDWFVSTMTLCSTVILFVSLLITSFTQKWWGLEKKLKQSRSWYEASHRDLMGFSQTEKNDATETR